MPARRFLGRGEHLVDLLRVRQGGVDLRCALSAVASLAEPVDGDLPCTGLGHGGDDGVNCTLLDEIKCLAAGDEVRAADREADEGAVRLGRPLGCADHCDAGKSRGGHAGDSWSNLRRLDQNPTVRG